VQEIRERVAMDDGVRLAISRFEPSAREPHGADGDDGPWPVIIEALPYRKDDLTASYRSEYRRLADVGRYVIVRVDVRGTGSSEGIASDEYPEAEQRDLLRVIEWCAEQPWSTGRIGMYGTSYSGFNSLQVAVEQPPELEAVCAIYATDDRYTDDVHYYGGVLRAVDLVDYVSYMVAMNALPPVPAVYGEGWREEWKRRLDGTEPWLLTWIEHQTDDAYWRHGSLRLDARPGTTRGYERIECATMIVAGWADGYRNNTLRTFASLQCAKRLLLGPWSHMATASSLPGPYLDLVPELIRFFDLYLRDRDVTDFAGEPPIRVFVRHATAPEPDLAQHAGEWRFEESWPAARELTRVLRPAGTGLDVVPVRGDVGAQAWISCAASLPWGQPSDQRADDAWSRCYDWPVDARFEILGNPMLRVRVTASASVAYLSAKLCDAFPDGTSALVTRGLVNLTHRESSTDPQPLTPGEPVDVEIELEATSWVFEPGHHLRLALAGTDWPNAWPPPAPFTMQVDRASVALLLPELPELPDDGSARTPTFAAPGPDAWHGGSDATEPQPAMVWRFTHDVLERRTRAIVSHGARYESELGAHVSEQYEGEVSVSTVDPGDATATATARFEIAWPDASCRAESRLQFRSDASSYHVDVELDADEGDEPVARQRWSRVIPRQLQ
jgi:uncharacterized protein